MKIQNKVSFHDGIGESAMASLNCYKTILVKLTAFLVFIAMANSCFSQQGKTNGMKYFTNDDFRLQYPESWELDTSEQWGTAVMLFSPIENEVDKFSENVNVLVQNLAGQNIDLEKYKQITEQQIATLATDGKIVESAIVRTTEGEHFRIIYTMTQGMFKLTTTSVCFIRDEKAYLVTFSSETAQYEHYKKTGEEILASFTLTRSP
jgi:hypothetical protein